ncbi:cytidylyltransferase domain-containing protein [Hirschia litorea]|uniref:N-acylneuraminate cytidylyltransferase n=1 Tax=Hirschia litorea TaxID=1199156 RepID=A0ABW2IPS4_9PROT
MFHLFARHLLSQGKKDRVFMSCIAIIPARGGSKGIPGKNLKKINGRSLLQRSIEAALFSENVDKVYVSSDDARILAEAVRSGAEAIKRPAEYASDTASSESALLHALNVVKLKEGLPDRIVFIQCTSPFIATKDVDGILTSMDREGADCALSVTPFHGFLWKPSENDGVFPVGHEKHFRPRRQDREDVYLETGAIYAMNVAKFIEKEHRFFDKVAHYVMEPMRSLEIDEPLDLKLCEEIARELENEVNRDKFLPKQVEALLLDFDGVLTDDLAIIDENGKEAVTVSRSDGMGIERLRNNTDVFIGVVSKEKNKVVAKRCEKLKVECLHGIENKVEVIQRWAKEYSFDLANVIYVGNDLNDLPVFDIVGLSVSPQDANVLVKEKADFVLVAKGGRGAVREICEIIISYTSK